MTMDEVVRVLRAMPMRVRDRFRQILLHREKFTKEEVMAELDLWTDEQVEALLWVLEEPGAIHVHLAQVRPRQSGQNRDDGDDPVGTNAWTRR